MSPKKNKLLTYTPWISLGVVVLFGGTWKGCVPAVDASLTEKIETVCDAKIAGEVVPTLESMVFKQAVLCDIMRKAYGDSMFVSSEKSVRATLDNALVGPKKRGKRGRDQ